MFVTSSGLARDGDKLRQVILGDQAPLGTLRQLDPNIDAIYNVIRLQKNDSEDNILK